ncbi:ShlB/FhaC/HecB family hemolysin secretion/activation protein [Ramlibacter henchirensis]|uniref:ShlB/FhaC/HecB family hemolysin secretion/activation protein n=1 Tax=Ramlibacter henchirensis TaxID=204072 RepID=UPI0014300780|nr:ShlB/FhaC/HecB family hemolysin secretion/activation protein [Ramlibacter henchirensis]
MKSKTWVAAAAASACALPVVAQQAPRPDAGILLQQERQAPSAPAAGTAPIIVPQPPTVAPFSESVRLIPAAFRVRGSTLFPEKTLVALLDDLVDKEMDMEGLVQAAARVRRYYRERGYLLTEAYLPEQLFPARNGAIQIHVVEARVGRVAVRREDDAVSESLANDIVRKHLQPGEHITEYMLEKPILLLRDLVGFDATAAVTPGANTGEADITVSVKPQGARADGVVGFDNFGARSAGAVRIGGTANLNNPTGRGDVLSANVQVSEHSGAQLYRIGYSTPVTGYATKVGVSVTRTEYALGKQFEALGATGTGDIYSVTATHPIIRSRTRNVIGALTYDHKRLDDETTTPPTDSGRRVDSIRASLLGNFVDEAIGSSFNSYSVNYTSGELKLDPATRASDTGPTGLRTSGSFSKVNLDFLRTTFLSAISRVSIGLQAQLASKNLTSAEKVGLGGPNGVRGYPVGEAVGDTGAIVSLEYRRQLPDLAKVPLSAGVFYDWGYVKYNEAGAPFPVTTPSESISSAGLGLTAGRYGDWLLTSQLAWRTDRAALSDPDRRPRLWLSLQKWL